MNTGGEAPRPRSSGNTAKISRRRFVGIAAAASLISIKPTNAAPALRWRGRALGAEASIALVHPDRRLAAAALAACGDELRRLEDIVSLFRSESAIVKLNRAGRVPRPPPELTELLTKAANLSALSDGAFDVTVQPLWQAYAKGGACREQALSARRLVDWRGVIVGDDEVRFARPGMAITLNGIAQGYITDRIVGLLRQRGFEHALVHMGEHRGIGNRADGLPWQLGIADPKSGAVIERVALRDRALATSSPLGTGLTCADAPESHHLFDPKSGRPAGHWSSVSVVARRAVDADGLSTAVVVAPPDRARVILEDGGAEFALLVDPAGRKTFVQSGKS